MTHKICLSAAALLALLLALPAPALAYDGATPDQPNRLSAGLSHTAYVDEHGTLWTWGSNQEGQLGAETQSPPSGPTGPCGRGEIISTVSWGTGP